MRVAFLLAVLALIIGVPSVHAAGTIYFRDGRQVQAEDWWEEPGTFYYVTRTLGQQGDLSSNVTRVQGEPNWARSFQTDARILFKDGGFADVVFLVVGPRDLVSLESDATTSWPRADVVRVIRIPAAERRCAATTIPHKELALTEEMVDRTTRFTSPTVNAKLRKCLELRRQAIGGSKPDASAMARACCAD
jgi:hypothetical protein